MSEQLPGSAAAEAAADAALAAGRVTEFATMEEMLADLPSAQRSGTLEVTLEYAGRTPLIPREDPDTADERAETREVLAAYAHEAWAGWMRYLFSKSTAHPDGTVTIPASLVARWQRQMDTAYADLPDAEKESDRAEADKMLALVAAPDGT